jgi:Protein of unknown function (DUF1571)
MARPRSRIWTTRLVLSLIAVMAVMAPTVWKTVKKLDSFEQLWSKSEATPIASTPSTELPKPTSRETHPLDPVLSLAREYLHGFQRDVQDYTATLTKRERINGELVGEEKMLLKLRCPRKNPDGTETKLHVYLRGKEPKEIEGREVIWVDGKNDGDLIAHEAGWMGLLRVKLDPNGVLAMRGNKYSITNIGIEQLLGKLIEKGDRDRNLGDCLVSIQEDQKYNDQTCTIIEVKHPEKRPSLDFHIARIYLDTTLRIPIRYEAFLWPPKPGGEPLLEEQYSYTDLKLNVGLNDKDFDPDNKAYQFP